MAMGMAMGMAMEAETTTNGCLFATVELVLRRQAGVGPGFRVDGPSGRREKASGRSSPMARTIHNPSAHWNVTGVARDVNSASTWRHAPQGAELP